MRPSKAMSWFRVSSVIFGWWGVVFLFFPRFTNEFMGIEYVPSGHAEDWTQIVGLCCLAFSVALHQTHRKVDVDVRRIVARGVLALTLPSALLMTYWQIIPDGRWFRLDIANVALLYMMSYGMFLHGDLRGRGQQALTRRKSGGEPR